MGEGTENPSDDNKVIVEEDNDSSGVMEVDRADPSDESVPVSQQSQSQSVPVEEGQDEGQGSMVLETKEADIVIEAEPETASAIQEEIPKDEETVTVVDKDDGQEEEGGSQGAGESESVGDISIKEEEVSCDSKEAAVDSGDGKAVVVKKEVGEEKSESGGSGTSSSVPVQVKEEPDVKVKTENVKLEPDVEIKTENIKLEADIKVEDDSYMVLDETDGSDNQDELSADETDDEDLPEVERLRRTNVKLNERLSLLEEFIEVEFADKFESFVKKRERLVDVMGLDSSQEIEQSGGKRPNKSKELVGILKLVKDQASSSSSTSMSNGNRKPSSTSGSRPNRDDRRKGGRNPNLKSSPSKSGHESQDKVSGSTPKKSGDAPKRCHRCRSKDHMVRDCPHETSRAGRRITAKERKREVKLKIEKEPDPEIRNLRNRRRRIGRVIDRMKKKNNANKRN